MIVRDPGISTSLVAGMMSMLMFSCASPRSPTGGPKDELPPAIVASESTFNQQTNFKEKEIIITFDEWVTLKDIYTQLVISPLMPDEPEIKQKGKSIIITLPDSLLEETTYTLNFGNAIADLNEGNVLENYSFVFSTGAVLDSVRLSGQVMDALTLKPSEGIWVMLHPVGEDSAVYKRKPQYLAKTNKEGSWSMANIRSDSFTLVALKDDNLNFLYDLDSELFGWQEAPVVTSVSNSSLPPIIIFPKEKRATITAVSHASAGWLKIQVSATDPKPMPLLIPEPGNAAKEWEVDTLHVWYPPKEFYSGIAVLNQDTIPIKVALNPSAQHAPFRIKSLTGRLNPLSSAGMGLDIPVESIDTSRIMLGNDSLGPLPFILYIDSSHRRRFEVKALWKEQTRYMLTFLPGAVQDIWGRVNDTIRNSIVVSSLDQFGDLILDVDGLDSTATYLLLIKSGEQIVERFVMDHLAATQLTKSGMLPGKYSIEITEDLNRNLIWDTGDYSKKRQPEKKRIFALENLRAGWELEAKLTWQ